MPKLTKRLSAIANYVKKESVVCDIGTDHGYLAIHLMQNKLASKVIATDINQKPLSNAKSNIEKYGVSGIELRLCDGLSAISSGEADTCVIAGMGGEVIAGIFERNLSFAQTKEVTFILQPTTSPEFLRRFLCDKKFEILEETAVAENRKLYSVMLVRYNGESYPQSESFYYVGKVSAKDEAGRLYVEKQKKRCFECMKSLEKVAEKEAEYLHYKTVFYELDSKFTFNGEQ